MARYVVDASTALRLAALRAEVDPANELLAPTLLRSEALSACHEAVHRGDLEPAEARDRLAYVHRLRIRYLGDAVLRKVAWEIADQLGWASTLAAEYIALTKLQADALVTLDDHLAGAAEKIVTTAPLEVLVAR